MTVGITCKECGHEVVFSFKEETTRPTKTCGCGAVYQLRVKRLE